MSLFTERLIRARNIKKMTKVDVANLFGWTPMYYGRYENGYLVPSKTNLAKFANFMGISTQELQSILESDISNKTGN